MIKRSLDERTHSVEQDETQWSLVPLSDRNLSITSDFYRTWLEKQAENWLKSGSLNRLKPRSARSWVVRARTHKHALHGCLWCFHRQRAQHQQPPLPSPPLLPRTHHPHTHFSCSFLTTYATAATVLSIDWGAAKQKVHCLPRLQRLVEAGGQVCNDTAIVQGSETKYFPSLLTSLWRASRRLSTCCCFALRPVSTRR